MMPGPWDGPSSQGGLSKLCNPCKGAADPEQIPKAQIMHQGYGSDTRAEANNTARTGNKSARTTKEIATETLFEELVTRIEARISSNSAPPVLSVASVERA